MFEEFWHTYFYYIQYKMITSHTTVPTYNLLARHSTCHQSENYY